jgi:hypothetical protein
MIVCTESDKCYRSIRSEHESKISRTTLNFSSLFHVSRMKCCTRLKHTYVSDARGCGVYITLTYIVVVKCLS